MTKFRMINGKPTPITPKKGGAALLFAVMVAGAIAYMSSGGGAGAAVGSVTDGSLSTKTGRGKADASNGNYTQAWTRLGLKQLKRKAEKALKCDLSSYGQVQKFFLRTPCRSLDRTLLVLGDGKGGTVVVSIAWVAMYSADAAERLKELADTDGTGSVTPRAAIALDMANVKFTGTHYHSDRRGAMIVIAEAAVGGGHPEGAAMDAATQVAVMFPPL